MPPQKSGHLLQRMCHLFLAVHPAKPPFTLHEILFLGFLLFSILLSDPETVPPSFIYFYLDSTEHAFKQKANWKRAYGCTPHPTLALRTRGMHLLSRSFKSLLIKCFPLCFLSPQSAPQSRSLGWAPQLRREESPVSQVFCTLYHLRVTQLRDGAFLYRAGSQPPLGAWGHLPSSLKPVKTLQLQLVMTRHEVTFEPQCPVSGKREAAFMSGGPVVFPVKYSISHPPSLPSHTPHTDRG